MMTYDDYFPGSSPDARTMSTPTSLQTVQVDVHRSHLDEDDDDDEYDEVLRDEGKDGEDLASVAREGRFQLKKPIHT